MAEALFVPVKPGSSGRSIRVNLSISLRRSRKCRGAGRTRQRRRPGVESEETLHPQESEPVSLAAQKAFRNAAAKGDGVHRLVAGIRSQSGHVPLQITAGRA